MGGKITKQNNAKDYSAPRYLNPRANKGKSAAQPTSDADNFEEHLKDYRRIKQTIRHEKQHIHSNTIGEDIMQVEGDNMNPRKSGTGTISPETVTQNLSGNNSPDGSVDGELDLIMEAAQPALSTLSSNTVINTADVARDSDIEVADNAEQKPSIRERFSAAVDGLYADDRLSEKSLDARNAYRVILAESQTASRNSLSTLGKNLESCMTELEAMMPASGETDEAKEILVAQLKDIFDNEKPKGGVKGAVEAFKQLFGYGNLAVRHEALKALVASVNKTNMSIRAGSEMQQHGEALVDILNAAEGKLTGNDKLQKELEKANTQLERRMMRQAMGVAIASGCMAVVTGIVCGVGIVAATAVKGAQYLTKAVLAAGPAIAFTILKALQLCTHIVNIAVKSLRCVAAAGSALLSLVANQPGAAKETLKTSFLSLANAVVLAGQFVASPMKFNPKEENVAAANAGYSTVSEDGQDGRIEVEVEVEESSSFMEKLSSIKDAVVGPMNYMCEHVVREASEMQSFFKESGYDAAPISEISMFKAADTEALTGDDSQPLLGADQEDRVEGGFNRDGI